MKRILLEGLLVAVVGAGLAFVANGLSPRGLKLTRNYFPGSGQPWSLAGASTKTNDAANHSNPADPSQSLDARLRAEGLQLADSNKVIQLFHDPRFEQGLVLFLDARDDSHYQEGHIPGAYQLDYFHPEKYLGPLLPLLQAAQQIVVYCNGGDCEDSRHAAIMLRDDVAVPAEKLFVYGGGIAEWSANKLPIEAGPRHSGKLLAIEVNGFHGLIMERADSPEASPAGPPRRVLDAATVVARWLLGLLFIYMGLSKALHPDEFLKLVRQYDITANPLLLNSIAAALPWFEVFCGLLLLAGIAVRGAALMLVAMLVPFSFVVLKRALALAAAQGIPFCAVKFDCGCGNGEVFICGKLLENGVLLCVALWLLAGRGRQLAPKSSDK